MDKLTTRSETLLEMLKDRDWVTIQTLSKENKELGSFWSIAVMANHLQKLGFVEIKPAVYQGWTKIRRLKVR